MTGPTIIEEQSYVARLTRRGDDYQVVVFGTTEDLSGQVITVMRKKVRPTRCRLGRLLAADDGRGHGCYYSWDRRTR